MKKKLAGILFAIVASAALASCGQAQGTAGGDAAGAPQEEAQDPAAAASKGPDGREEMRSGPMIVRGAEEEGEGEGAQEEAVEPPAAQAPIVTRRPKTPEEMAGRDDLKFGKLGTLYCDKKAIALWEDTTCTFILDARRIEGEMRFYCPVGEVSYKGYGMASDIKDDNKGYYRWTVEIDSGDIKPGDDHVFYAYDVDRKTASTLVVLAANSNGAVDDPAFAEWAGAPAQDAGEPEKVPYGTLGKLYCSVMTVLDGGDTTAVFVLDVPQMKEPVFFANPIGKVVDEGYGTVKDFIPQDPELAGGERYYWVVQCDETEALEGLGYEFFAYTGGYGIVSAAHGGQTVQTGGYDKASTVCTLIGTTGRMQANPEFASAEKEPWAPPEDARAQAQEGDAGAAQEAAQ